MPQLRALLVLLLCVWSAGSIGDGVSLEESLFDDPTDYDEDDTKYMGEMFQHFLADSETQMIVDMDLFKHMFQYPKDYEASLVDGDVDFVKYAVAAVNKIKELDVSAACVADVFHFVWSGVEYATHVKEHKNCTDCQCTPLFKQVRNERQWIFNVLDSWGKIPAGVLGGNNLWVGSWNTCRKIRVQKNKQGQEWAGQYCLTHLTAFEEDNPLAAIGKTAAPDAHCYSSPNESTSPAADAYTQCFDVFPLLNFGLCVPDTCTDYDVEKMVKFATSLAEGVLGRPLACDISVECKNEREEAQRASEPLTQAVMALLLLTLILVIFGTAYDEFVFRPYVEKESTGGRPKPKRSEQPTLVQILLAYSFTFNGGEVLHTGEKKEGEIDSLHGMRFLSMAWIILGHTYYYIGTSLTTDNLFPTLMNFPKSFYTQIIVQAPLAVDSFFYLSGLLASYMFFKKLRKTKEVPPARLSNPLTWVFSYVKRYTRVVPVYLVIMLLDVTVFTIISNGPFWRPIEKQGCRVSGWTNLIFMNNFLWQEKECCMGWTWYLANDFQFHVVLIPILIFTFYHWPILGYCLSFALIAGSSLIQMQIMFAFDYPPAPILTSKLQIVKKLGAYWSDVYVKPYVRCAPFIVGVVVGYLLIDCSLKKTDIKFKMNKAVVIIGWTLSTILGLYSVFGLFNYAKTGEISDWYKILYVLCGRPAYSVAIGWVTFACATGNGGIVEKILGWKFFLPLSRITFCAYLIHPVILQVYNFSRHSPFHFATFFQMLRHMFEALFASYLLAFFIFVMFEKPFDAMLGQHVDKLRTLGAKKESNGTAVELAPLENGQIIHAEDPVDEEEEEK